MTTDPLPVSTDQALPGLGEPDVSRPGELELAVRRSLRFMNERGLVDERHAGLMQLALTLSRSIRPGDKAYGVAQCAAQLLAVFDKLLPDEEGGQSDGWSELRAFIAGVDSAGGSSPVGHPG